MDAVFSRDEGDTTCVPAPSVPRFVLDRTAIATGAACRRARAKEIEAAMHHACERAALRSRSCWLSPDRRSWDRRAWDPYVAEAVRQAHARASELESLRREAAQLDRLLRAA